MSYDSWREAETLARKFHEQYERWAPEFNYETRPESAVPWEDVPLQNKKLMIQVCRMILSEYTRTAVLDELE